MAVYDVFISYKSEELSEAIKKMIREIKAIKGCEEMSFVEKNFLFSKK